jgi:hypothetical protein
MVILMITRELFHGTDGDAILQILHDRQMRPNAQGKIFFAEHRYDSGFMHGGDRKRKLTFAMKVRVQVPAGIQIERSSTHGVSDTLILHTMTPIPADILELYVREPHGSAVQTIRGGVAILQFLTR